MWNLIDSFLGMLLPAYRRELAARVEAEFAWVMAYDASLGAAHAEMLVTNLESFVEWRRRDEGRDVWS